MQLNGREIIILAHLHSIWRTSEFLVSAYSLLNGNDKIASQNHNITKHSGNKTILHLNAYSEVRFHKSNHIRHSV